MASTVFTATPSSTHFCNGPISWSVCCRSRRRRGNILDRGLLARLNRNSPIGAPVLINAGRGGLQNEADILGCLDDGTLGAASLDVFAEEPLPANSRFWTHPRVVLTPHNAADTDPDEISKYVARQIERFEAGGALENVVDPARGY
jgi:glyoxylate/hydroxypyruvate reductase A